MLKIDIEIVHNFLLVSSLVYFIKFQEACTSVLGALEIYRIIEICGLWIAC